MYNTDVKTWVTPEPEQVQMWFIWTRVLATPFVSQEWPDVRPELCVRERRPSHKETLVVSLGFDVSLSMPLFHMFCENPFLVWELPLFPIWTQCVVSASLTFRRAKHGSLIEHISVPECHVTKIEQILFQRYVLWIVWCVCLWPCVCHNVADGIGHGVVTFVISVFDEEPCSFYLFFVCLVERCLVSFFVWLARNTVNVQAYKEDTVLGSWSRLCEAWPCLASELCRSMGLTQEWGITLSTQPDT